MYVQDLYVRGTLSCREGSQDLWGEWDYVSSCEATEGKIGIRCFMKRSLFLLLFSAVGGVTAQKNPC
ncbi:hypothetical protein HRbin08_01656 [bacterium HR08]|nr:hypothetical protein HRbin08_01656 [bacterium HR08]